MYGTTSSISTTIAAMLGETPFAREGTIVLVLKCCLQCTVGGRYDSLLLPLEQFGPLSAQCMD